MQTLVMPQVMMRFVLAWTSLVLALEGTFAQEPSLQLVGPRFSARHHDGRAKPAQFVRKRDPSDIGLTSDLALDHVVRLDLPARQLDQAEPLPLKRISLINGDSFTASFVSLTKESCRVVDEGISAEIPRDAIASIGTLDGMSDLFCVVMGTKKPTWRCQPEPLVVEDSRFERVLSLPSNSRAELTLEHPLTRGELKLWLRDSHSDAEQTRIDFFFAERSEPLTLWWKPRTDSGNAVCIIAREGEQQIGEKHQVTKNDWCCIRMLLDDDLHLAINQAVLATLSSRNHRLRGVRLESTFSTPSADNSSLLIGPCFAQQRIESSAKTVPVSQQDAVQFRNGDLLFGTLKVASSSSIELNVRSRQLELSWSEVQRVIFPAPPSGNSLPSISGWLARIDLQLSQSESNSQSMDVLHGAISGVNERGLELQHPLVGSMMIDWNLIRRVTPVLRGTAYPIELRRRHVGNQLRDDFQRPEPEGPQLRIDFNLPSQPTGPCMLRLKLMDLEPAGPETLRASPTLKELREGNLATLVFLNGKSLGSLNNRISVWSTSTAPQQIRIPIDTKMLQVGMNLVELKQSPARRDATRFDDFELLSLTLDVEAP